MIKPENAFNAADSAWEETSTKKNASVGKSGINYRRMSDIQPKPVYWLWPRMIARGKLTMIAGNPGLGKSQLTASLAAIVTTGGGWPANGGNCELGDVAFLSAEDDAADTIRPRMDAAGADSKRIFILDSVSSLDKEGKAQQRSFTLQEDIARLDQLLEEKPDIALVVIDPITAYMGGVDSHKTADVRGMLAPLAEMAARRNVALVCISHLNKSAGNEAMMRVTGSLAFVAAARAAFFVGADSAEPSRRLFLPIKNNIGNDRTGLAFSIKPCTLKSGIETSYIVWEDAIVHQTANDVLAEQGQAGNGKEEKSALQDAINFLREVLAEGPVSAKEVYKQAADACIAQRTIKRAKDELGIKAKKQGMDQGWVWILLPAKDANNIEECHT